MRYCPFTPFLLTALTLVGCQSGVTNIPVSPNSEFGRQILEMDAKGRAVQNAPFFSEAMLDFEAAHGGNCTNIAFNWLQEPGQKVSRYVCLYMMEGESPTCGKRIYRARITFDDLPHTVAKRVEILERFFVPSQDEETSYREKATEFIKYAQAGDVQQMIAITSPHTYATDTGSSVHTIYAEDVAPQFHEAVVTWDTQNTPCTDEQNNVGFIFTGTARGKKTFSFDVIVYKENGRLVIANIKKHH
jgi:hypothetical protein